MRDLKLPFDTHLLHESRPSRKVVLMSPIRSLPLHGGNDAKGVESGRSFRAIMKTVVALTAAARPRGVIYLCLRTSVRDQRHSAIRFVLTVRACEGVCFRRPSNAVGAMARYPDHIQVCRK
ncbi:hypothetical protein [Mesorhizobium sp. M1403]|uniref:hypothetical protein n=1 Tax=Mesorhizobium sp. M1403 TaxID=2957097 RepID=UPI00333D5932